MVARPKKEGQVKVTISLPDSVILKAKIYAIENRKTVSGLIEELLKREIGTKEAE
jgi:hypothetical protein